MRKVISAFAVDAKAKQADHIFIAGDVFHTKTQGISPEYIDFMTWMLKTLADVAPVHIMLGNHDGALSNTSRQDAVSPIVAALGDTRVKLYKQSGVYEFAPGFNWCVFSLFDKEGWDNVKAVPGMVNIACFHGSVWGAKTELDWELEGETDIEFFKSRGFDFVLLGDIHKQQFLDYRETELVIDESELSRYPLAQVLGDA